jgi:hypothetical protein
MPQAPPRRAITTAEHALEGIPSRPLDRPRLT